MLAVLQESFWERLSAVLRLKRPTFETIQRDPEATTQAWWIVVLLGLANGIALIATPVVTVFPGMSEQMATSAAEVAASSPSTQLDGGSWHWSPVSWARS
jgi:hypothetical protein